jgi:general secretion pathway protein I
MSDSRLPIRTGACRQRGFTLLEVLVAFLILALTLAVIYQTAGGSVRATIKGDRQTYALTLAESVLNSYRDVPEGGMTRSGELENGFRWRLDARPRPVPEDQRNRTALPLYDARVEVNWDGGAGVVLHSVLPERVR